MPTFTHALMLRQGICVAQGQKREILSSELLTKTFGIPVKVTEEGDRYWSRIPLGVKGVDATRNRQNGNSYTFEV